MSFWHNNGLNKRRVFQSTGMGLDRANGDALPEWKRNVFNSVRNRAKKHRHLLIQRLKKEKKENLHLSPNSKKKQANNTINSYRNEMIKQELQQKYNQENKEFEQISKAQFESVMSELEQYLEENELSELRKDIIRQLADETTMDWQLQTQSDVQIGTAKLQVVCPICNKHEMEIHFECDRKIYGCQCGAKFQPSDKSVSLARKIAKKSNDIDCKDTDEVVDEDDITHAKRMLTTLNNNLISLFEYHKMQLKCECNLMFCVQSQFGYLQAWCQQCNCNEYVI